MTISLATIRVDIFADVYAAINTNVADPLARGKQWIFSTSPNTLLPTFVGFPIIIIGAAKIGKDFEVFDNSYSDKKTPITITIYATNKAQVDSLSDTIDVVMVPSNFSQFTFRDYSEANTEPDLGSGKVYARTMVHSVEIDNL